MLTGAPATAQTPLGADQSGAATLDPALYEALARDLGLNRAEAEAQLAAQATAERLAGQLEEQIGARFGGAWFDPERLTLVVGVLNRADAAVVEAVGAHPVPVTYRYQTLVEVVEQLNALHEHDPDLLAAATSWGVDVARNRVEVVARAGRADELVDLLEPYGELVTLTESEFEPRPMEWLDAGQPYWINHVARCTAGFNVTNGQQNYFLTSGHCGRNGGTAWRNGIVIGPIVHFRFPGYDDALVRVDNSYWQQGGYIATYPGFRTIFGYTRAPVGSAVCKSGSTTGWTCGTITAWNQTVKYPQGTVYGLNRSSMCAEAGDSGAPVVSITGGSAYAEGILSGGTGNCQYGGITYYMPIASTLDFYSTMYRIELMHF